MNIHQVIAIGVTLILGAPAASAADEASSDTLMSVTIAGERLGEILKQLGEQSGYQIMVDSKLARSRGPQMYVAPIPALRALRVVAAAYGVCADVVSDTLVAFRACDEVRRLPGASSIDQPNEQPTVRLGIVIEKKGAEYPPNGDTGVAVSGTDRHGAGYKAGIREGDVILSYNRQPISGAEELRSLVGNTRPGTTIPVVVLRGSERISFNVQF
jgi:hypothetical protein